MPWWMLVYDVFMQVYVGRDGNQRGPYSLEQVQQYLAQGVLQLTDLAWYEGLEDWIPLGEVPGVVVVPRQAPPVFPKAAPKQGGEEYGGFWARAAAAFIDFVNMLLIFALTVSLLYGGEWWELQEEAPDYKWEGIFAFWLDWVRAMLPVDYAPGFFLGEFLGGFLFPAIYVIWFNAAKSATPGKMALGLKIVDARNGRKPSIGQFVGRYVSGTLSYIPFLLGYFWVAWDKRKQGFHDHIARTVVVKKRDEDEQSQAHFVYRSANAEE